MSKTCTHLKKKKKKGNQSCQIFIKDATGCLDYHWKRKENGNKKLNTYVKMYVGHGRGASIPMGVIRNEDYNPLLITQSRIECCGLWPLRTMAAYGRHSL